MSASLSLSGTPLDGQLALVTGGSGVLGRAMCGALAAAGARVLVGSRSQESAAAAIAEVVGADSSLAGRLIPLSCDVLDPPAIRRSGERVAAEYGVVDLLVNAAGGNQAGAATDAERDFFALDLGAVNTVMQLNFQGTLLATQVFAAGMARRGHGGVINITSMAAVRPLTRVVGYSAAKAAVVNFTQWLAVHLAQTHGPGLRVNALAPGFFLTEQNRALLTTPHGEPTPRAASILAHTPQGRFGTPDDLLSTLLWLASPGSRFVTGTVIPVDGGFSAYGGV